MNRTKTTASQLLSLRLEFEKIICIAYAVKWIFVDYRNRTQTTASQLLTLRSEFEKIICMAYAVKWILH